MDSQTIHILSADAPKGGLRDAADSFVRETGIRYHLELATGPVIKQRVAAGETEADLVIIPSAWLNELEAGGSLVAGSVRPIGKITVGVTVRNGAVEPDISTVDAFVASMMAADKVIYNTASSGTYVAEMLARIGLADRIAEKTVILPTGIAVMEMLAADPTGRAIAFGHVTEIRRHDDKGTHLVGALPGEIGRETLYGIGLRKGAPHAEAGKRLLDYLTGEKGRAIFTAAGVL